MSGFGHINLLINLPCGCFIDLKDEIRTLSDNEALLLQINEKPFVVGGLRLSKNLRQPLFFTLL